MSASQFGAEQTFIPAIGRELDPTYLEHIGKVARRILPTAVEFRLRKQTGITYVTAPKLDRKTSLEAEDDEERLSLLRKYASSTIQSLSDQGALDSQAAHKHLGVALDKPTPIHLKTPRVNHITLTLNVIDTLFTSDDEETYQIEAEKDTYAARFSIKTDASSLQIPKYNVSLGQISHNVLRAHLAQLGRALEEPVPFLGIDGFNVALLQP